MGRYTTQSSAKRLTLEFSPTGKSLMYMRKSRGHNDNLSLGNVALQYAIQNNCRKV